MSAHSLSKRLIEAGGPYELKRDQADGLARFVRAPHTLPDLIGIASRAADRPLLRMGARSLTLHQALDRAARLRTLLASHVEAGQVVGLTLEDPIDWTVAFLALQGLAVSVALLPREPNDCAKAACLAGCSSLLGSPGYQASDGSLSIFEFDQGLFVVAGERPRHALDDVLPTLPIPAPVSNVALIAFTSGTTSKPKAVPVTHENLITGLRTMQLGAALAALRRTTPSPRPAAGRARTLLLSPLDHVGGYGQVVGTLMSGAELIFPLERTPEAIAAVVAEERISAIMGAPERLVWDLARLRDRYDLSSLTTLGIFGVALEPEAFSKITEILPNVRPGASYGLTETSGAVAIASDDDLQLRPGTSGALMPNVDLQVRNVEGRVLGAGQEGWIWVRGAMVMGTYIGRETPVRDGWFKTGDQGWLDSDGFVFLIDRASFMVSVAGQDLTSGGIESLVRAVPGVAEAAVVRPESRAAFAAVVFVATLEAACARAVGHALDSAWPAAAPGIAIVEIESLPRTRSGKIDRQALLAVFEQTQAAPRSAAS